MRTSRIAIALAAATAAAMVVAGCSSDPKDPKDSKDSTVSVPEGFDVPAGVSLTEGGAILKLGRPASVVYQVGNSAASAITVTVTTVDAGSIEDFKFFSLDEAAKKSSPYYVRVTVKNEGPAGLGGAALPIVARTSRSTDLPASDIVGTFEPCQGSTLPATFLKGASAALCLVYLVPDGQKLRTVQLQTGAAKDAVSWKP